MTEDISSEKRRHERRETLITIDYLVDRLNADEISEGVVADISESGFCLLSANQLIDGEKIAIKNKMPSVLRSAVVRWSHENNNLYYKIGLEFV
jgi:hypothetical protein